MSGKDERPNQYIGCENCDLIDQHWIVIGRNGNTQVLGWLSSQINIDYENGMQGNSSYGIFHATGLFRDYKKDEFANEVSIFKCAICSRIAKQDEKEKLINYLKIHWDSRTF